MAAKSKNLTIKFIADTQSAIKNIDMLDKALKGFGKTTTGSPSGGGKGGVVGNSSKAMNFLSTATKDTGGAFGGLAGQVGVAASSFAVLTFSMKNMLSAGMEAEDAIVKLGVLFKNEAKGMEVYQKALKQSIVTPFDPKDIVAGAVQAQGYIGKAGDVFTRGLYGMKGDAATLIADMAAFSGQTAVEAATALFRADLALLDKYGADARKAYAKAKKAGQIGTEAFVKTFVKGMSEVATWQGMAAKRSQTISGLVSTIKGNVGLIFTYLSGATAQKGVETFWSHLRVIMTDISTGLGKLVEELKPVFMFIGAYIGRTLGYVWEVISFIWSIIGPLVKFIWAFIKPIIQIIWAIQTFVFKIFSALLKIILNTGGFFVGWLDLLLGISTKISTVVGWLEKFVLWLNMIFTLVMGAVDAWISNMSNWIKGLPELIKDVLIKAWEYISAFFKKIGDKISKLGDEVNQYVTGKFTTATEFVGEQREKAAKFLFGEKKELPKSEQPLTSIAPSGSVDNSKKQTVNNNNTYNIINMTPGERDTNLNLTGAPAF